MSQELIQVLGIIGLIISIPTALGAMLALVRASYNKAQTEQLRSHNEDLRKRVADVEHNELELKTENAANTVKVEMLTEMVTQRADLETHHVQVMQNYAAMSQTLDKMMIIMKEIHNATT